MTEIEISEALAHKDAEVRRRAVTDILDAQGEGLGDLLMRALGDEDWRVRKQAVLVGRQCASELDVLKSLVGAITQGNNVGLRNSALELLGELGGEVVDALVEALPKVSEGERKFVVEALAACGEPRVVDVLLEVAESGDPLLEAAAMDAMAAMGGPAAERLLRTKLNTREGYLRMAALDGLNRLRAVLPWSDLQPLLQDKLAFRLAVQALGRCGSSEAVEPLLRALGDRSSRLAADAVVALHHLQRSGADLGQLVDDQVRELAEPQRQRLRELCEHAELEPRQAACHLLVLSRDGSAFGAVSALVAEDALATETLLGLAVWGQDAVEGFLALATRAKPPYGAAALHVGGELAVKLAEQGPLGELEERIRRQLRALLSADDPDLRLAAVHCLGPWAQAADAKRLVALMVAAEGELLSASGQALAGLAAREPSSVNEALDGVPLDGPAGPVVARMVAQLGGDHAFSRLHGALLASEPTTRAAAIESLSQLGGARAVELIALSLTDESPEVQLSAAHALGTINDSEGRDLAVESLRLALRGNSAGVQAASARALGRAQDGNAIPLLRELARTGAAEAQVGALEALRVLGDEGIDELLLDALSNTDTEVVKQGLVGLHDRAGQAAAIEGCLSHAAWDVRELAARLLGDARSVSSAPVLRERLELEQDDLVVEAVKEALSKLGD